MEKNCPICNTNIDAFAFNRHIPKCYHQSCVANEEIPLCTCLICKGIKTHDGDFLHKIQNSTTPHKRRSVTAPATLGSMSQTQSLGTFSEDVSPKLHPDKLSGKECICCTIRTAAKGFPKIYVGKYRTLILCKKSHALDNTENKRLAEMIDKINDEVISTNDSKQSILDGESDEENAIEDVMCSGCKNVDSSSMCGAVCKGTLYIKEKKGQTESNIFFCKGSHLIKYLVRHYCSHKSGKKKKTNPNSSVTNRSSKKRTKDQIIDESETDDECEHDVIETHTTPSKLIKK